MLILDIDDIKDRTTDDGAVVNDGTRLAQILIGSAKATLRQSKRGRKILMVREDALQKIQANLPYVLHISDDGLDGARNLTLELKPSRKAA